jgi:hypothetical protein
MTRDVELDPRLDSPCPPEGRRILEERGRVRAEVEILQERIATVRAEAAVAGRSVRVRGTGPELTFYSPAQSIVQLFDEAKVIVKALREARA